MFWSTLLMALQEIRRNALRSFLTMLGMVIGVGAVITLVSVGQGTTAQVTADIAKMGKNLIMVFPGSGHRRSGTAASAPPFEAADAVALSRVQGVKAIAPVASANVLVVYGNRNESTQVTGTTAAYLGIREYTVASGRAFTASEEATGQAVCLIGATTRDDLFGSQDPIGESIRAQRMSCRVIGVLASKGQSAGGMDQDDLVLMPLLAFQRRISGTTDIASFFLSAADDVSTEPVIAEIQSLLRERRRIPAGTDNNFEVRDTQEIARMVTSATASMTALLGAIAAVSLIVGGIGIMNIMLVSVTERTREIGIRIAIGALGREVMLQFLVESVVLSVLGGLIGVLFGVAGAFAISRGLSMPFVVSPGTILLAFAVSALVGVVFGYLPAHKAARLEPIEALRHE
ncbi:MAG TPA: ABC transporter permease [Myxococcota bacterium]|jgi:putative ABC transport system permease protein|nr:ABC transporter permease [Myxococcota bacterium]